MRNGVKQSKLKLNAGASLALVIVLGACTAARRNAPDLAESVRRAPGGYISGPVVELGERRVLEDRDFVYAIAIAPDGSAAAYTHLGPRSSELAIFSLTNNPLRRANIEVNPYEFDLEAVEFSPESASVAVVSRDGAVRLYDAKTGASQRGHATEEPLVSLAFHPSGRYLAVGSARGLITVLRVPELEFVSELRVHADEVRGLAFDREGRLYSAGWDKVLARLDGAERPLDLGRARVRFDRLGDAAVVRATVNGQAAGSFTLDQRTPVNLISSALLKTAGIDPLALSETVTVQTALGSTEARLARDVPVRFKAFELPQDFAVCDACVPQNVQAVLGAPFLEQVDVRFDATVNEALLAARGEAPASTKTGWVLTQGDRREYPHFLNDVTVDASGTWLGVAFSEEKAQRTREVYEREKRGVPEKVSEGNAPALIDAASLEVVSRFPGHRGVVSTAAVSPDGKTIASGGWDRTLRVNAARGEPVAGASGPTAPAGSTGVITRDFGWSVRRVRFSRDGVSLGVGAWTPQRGVGDQRSDPAAVIYEVIYEKPQVVSQ